MIDNIGAKVELSDGQKIPGYGYGCYLAHGDELFNAIRVALEVGYRYLDTAAFYQNEDTAGAAIRDFPREELFVLSKIWPSSFDRPVEALDTSLKALGLDYLDGYLLHWPGLNEKARLNAYEALMREREKGKIKILGVSNFTHSKLESLRDHCGEWPVVNQIEVHPLYQEKDLCDYCAHRYIQVISWSPLGRGKGMDNPVIVEIARACGKTPAQIILRWQVQKNYIAIPKSVHVNRVRENADVFNFSLTPEQMTAINGLNLPNDAGKLGKDPDKFPEV